MSRESDNERKSNARAPRVGLVIGAGGITGFAYHSGVLSALGRLTGWDPRTAEVIVGTSAGSGFGAMLRGGVQVDDVLAHLLAAPSNPETMARLRVLSGRELNTPSWLWYGPAAPRLLLQEMRRPWRVRPSRVAVSLTPNGRIPTEFLGDRARELHGLDWPEATYWACAVRLSDGARVVFGADDVRTDVGTAVEASSAIPGFFRPVWIHGERYVDGAVHSPTNADLLAGLDLDLVVVLSPMSSSCNTVFRSLDGVSRLAHSKTLDRELEQLEKPGREVLVLEPGPEEINTMGPINMDPTRMIPTLLQASASTLQHLGEPEHDAALMMLRRAAETMEAPPAVPYPTSTTPRLS